MGFLGGTATSIARGVEAQQLSLNGEMIESPFSTVCGKYISGLYRKNVHHANEPGSCGDSSYGEIRRSCLCLAPLIHLLRGPRARIVRPWVYGRRQVKTSARELMAKRTLAERRYRTAARLRAGSEIMGRGEGLDTKSGRDQSRVVRFRSQLIKSQSGVGNNDLGFTTRTDVVTRLSPSSLPSLLAPREQCVTPSKNIPFQPYRKRPLSPLEFRPPCPLHLLQTRTLYPLYFFFQPPTRQRNALQTFRHP